MKKLYLILFAQVISVVSFAQVRFDCTGDVYTIKEGTRSLDKLVINTSNNSITYTTINDDIGVDLNAIGFRRTDRFIYGIEEGTTNLIRVDANGNSSFIANLSINETYGYFAGDFSNDGRYYTVVGRSGEDDQVIYFIDMNLGDYSWQSVGLSGNTKIEDIANKPETSDWYGYDSKNKNVLFINVDEAILTGLFVLEGKDQLESVYFDPFSQLYGIGNTAFGIAHALFSINQENGVLTQLSTGPQTFIKDATTCPYTVDIEFGADARTVLPCSEIEFEVRVGNASGQAFENMDLSIDIPVGLDYKALLSNGFSKPAQYVAASRTLEVNGFVLQPGITRLTFRGELGNISEGTMKIQGELDGLPQIFGGQLLTDNPATNAFNDPISIDIIRPVEDSITIDQLLCAGESVALDGSEYGNGLVWDNGSMESQRVVESTGLYSLESENSCLEIYVGFNVTEATCPYTLEMHHEVVPPEFFPCSQVVLRFILENDSGFTHRRLRFRNRIPDLFTFIEIADGPPGSKLEPSNDPLEVVISNLTMRVGLDTLDLLVEIGDEPPQLIYNRAEIHGFPTILGPFRMSDDPRSLPFDSTEMEVLGTLEDTLNVMEVVCPGEVLELDGAPYGVDFLWEDGSKDSIFEVVGPGVYQLKVFDGCDPSTIFFEVEWAKDISIDLPAMVEIHLGDSIYLEPVIANEGDSVDYFWSGEDLSALYCDTCLITLVKPYESIYYQLNVNNEECRDSFEVLVDVDNSRRIYFPNAFSPNGDTWNDVLFFQSPDYGLVKEFVVFDRWGTEIFRNENFFLNDEAEGWGGSDLKTGVYVYFLKVEFLDGLTETFSGDVTILR